MLPTFFSSHGEKFGVTRFSLTRYFVVGTRYGVGEKQGCVRVPKLSASVASVVIWAFCCLAGFLQSVKAGTEVSVMMSYRDVLTKKYLV